VLAGQTEVKNFPILDLGIVPEIDTENWQLRIYGLVENELNLD
jgi:DMSO/TMAO reductase YedYZ molybdopterin-dependent catalytic subunit